MLGDAGAFGISGMKESSDSPYSALAAVPPVLCFFLVFPWIVHFYVDGLFQIQEATPDNWHLIGLGVVGRLLIGLLVAYGSLVVGLVCEAAVLSCFMCRKRRRAIMAPVVRGTPGSRFVLNLIWTAEVHDDAQSGKTERDAR